MIANLRLWFAALSLREKRLVLVAMALAALTLFWFGLIRPVSDGLYAARVRHNDAVLRLAATEAQLRDIAQMQRNRPPPLQAPLDETIRARASAAGFALSNVTPQPGNAVQVQIAAARPIALFGWVAQLEADGIIVVALSTTDNGDRTLAAVVTLKAQGL